MCGRDLRFGRFRWETEMMGNLDATVLSLLAVLWGLTLLAGPVCAAIFDSRMRPAVAFGRMTKSAGGPAGTVEFGDTGWVGPVLTADRFRTTGPPEPGVRLAARASSLRRRQR